MQMILLCLDQRSLLTSAQRVNKYWHDVIQNTLAIQQALFFKAFPTSYNGPPVFNPILVEVFHAWFPGGVNHRGHECPKKDVIVYHDTLQRLLPTIELHRIFRCRRASWTRMLVRQPPIRALCERHIYNTRMGTYSHAIKKQKCRRGLRMGKLYDLASKSRLDVYWQCQIEEVTPEYTHPANTDERWRTRLHRIAKTTDLTVKTWTSATCVKPRPPNRTWMKFGRGLKLPDGPEELKALDAKFGRQRTQRIISSQLIDWALRFVSRWCISARAYDRICTELQRDEKS